MILIEAGIVLRLKWDTVNLAHHDIFNIFGVTLRGHKTITL
jgi:hypothetical protein